jgi:hypothetical protein
MTDDRHADIIKNLLVLFDVKPSPVAETVLFKNLSQQQEELDNAFEYWIDRSKEIFGEEGKIEKTHGLKEAGIDLSLNLLQSKFKLGVQIKTYNDIKDPIFSTLVSGQRTQSLKHKLSKFLIAFAADMTDKKQIQKVRGVISEFSQHDDNYVIPLSPEKVLTIYKVYKAKDHPLNHVFLKRSKATKLLTAIANNLDNPDEKVEIKMKIKNLKKDNVSRPRKFKLDLSFNKESKDKLKILDDLRNQTMTDKVIRIDKTTADHYKITDENSKLEDDTIKQDEKIWSWVEKPGRKFLSFQTISYSGQMIQSHHQVVDMERNDESIKFIPMDMQGPLKIGLHTTIPKQMQDDLKAGVPVKGPLPIMNTSFNFKISGFDVKTIYEKLNFLSSLSNAHILRVVIPEDNITSDMGNPANVPAIPQELLSLFGTLSALQDRTGTTLSLPEDIILNQNTVTTIMLTATYLLHIIDTKVIPKTSTNVKIRSTKSVGMAILKDYEKKLIHQSSMFRIQFSQPLLGSNIEILNAQLDLSQYTPITKLDDISATTGEAEIELQPVKKDNPPYIR